MNFFERQDAARRASRRLLWLLVPAMLALVLAANAAALLFWWFVRLFLLVDVLPAWPPVAFYVVVSLIAAWIIVTGAWDSMIIVGKGGAEVAKAMGARPADASPTELSEQRLRNVVEEMTIASGLPAPGVFVMEAEVSINAFTAGLAAEDAAIVVTRGALRALDRDELQGMVAHEFSHILNGDVRLNMRLFALLGGILRLWTLGEELHQRMEQDAHDAQVRGMKPKGNALYALGGGLLKAVGSFGAFLARPISASVARERELLADACALQFTRDADGLAGALEKLRRDSQGGRIHHPWAEQAGHMFFASARPAGRGEGFPTHPPVGERLRRLRGRAAPAVTVPQARSPGAAIASIGTPTPAQVAMAASLLGTLPQELRDALRVPDSAALAMCSLVLAPEGAGRQAQLQLLGSDAPAAIAARAAIDALGRGARLPLLELAVPALRALDGGARRGFLARFEALIAADRRVTLEEFVLESMLAALLREPGDAGDRPADSPLLAHLAEARVLLSVAAHAGGADPATAFASGRNALDVQMDIVPPGQLTLPAVRAAIAGLRRLHPLHKPRLLKALAGVVLADGRVAAGEGELLRAMSAALDCPMPPLAAAAPR